MMMRITILAAIIWGAGWISAERKERRQVANAAEAATPTAPAASASVQRVYGPDQFGIACYAHVKPAALGAGEDAAWLNLVCLPVAAPRAGAHQAEKKVTS